jgi:site-specific DNA-cytosine methylase
MGNILLACEESQAVTKAFRDLGHDAYSCDILPTSGDHPEWHLQQDVLPILDEQWDMIIAFPPCTHLATSGARWFKEKIADGRQQEGIDFFMAFTNLRCPRVVIENPVGIMSTNYRKPDQIIQPWMFGESFAKKTCLWIKGVPHLVPTDIVDEGEYCYYPSGKRMSKWYANSPVGERKTLRSKTFQGIANAMADTWGPLIE